MNRQAEKNIYKHIACIIITLSFVLFGILVFPLSFNKTAGAIKDLGISLYNFTTVFTGKQNIPSGVNVISDTFVPFVGSPDNFKDTLSGYWNRLISSQNMKEYALFVISLFVYLPFLALFAFVLIFILLILSRRHIRTHNNKYGDSFFLRLYKNTFERLYYPLKNYILSLAGFTASHPLYLKLWVLIWLYNLNILKIALSALAFVLTFNYTTLFIQLYKLLQDLSSLFSVWYLWVIPGYCLLNRYRSKIALLTLYNLENRNRFFMLKTPPALMLTSPMNSGKTTLLTDMSLTMEVLFRDQALKILHKHDLMFKCFPWINLENTLREAVALREVVNLAQCETYIRYLEERFISDPCKDNCFGYDFERYGLLYYDGVKDITLFDCILEYSKAYLIYIVKSSLIISNYSIRSNNVFNDSGNFPRWETDFFRKALPGTPDRFSHILDYDTLRLSKYVSLEEKDNYYEFGILVITEIGKELGNQNTNKGLKLTDKETNTLNDGLTERIKMIRNGGTVDKYPFAKLFTDDQRADDLKATAKDLCTVIDIVDVAEKRLTYPLFFFTELLYDIFHSRFLSRYLEYRYNRSDNTLLMYLYKNLDVIINNRYNRIYNRYGYNIYYLTTEKVKSGVKEEHEYYISFQKRDGSFKTDVFAGFFNDKALKAKTGLEDIPSYQSITASPDELDKQNSYLIRKMKSLSKEPSNVKEEDFDSL